MKRGLAPHMTKKLVVRLVYLLVGIFVFSLGITQMIQANIGYAAWDVLNDGVAKTAGVSIGYASIGVGVALMVVVILFREKIGLGSILNMVLVGVFIDLIRSFRIIPTAKGYMTGLPLLFSGMVTLAFASYLYINSGFGAGPRDSVMIIIMRKTKQPVGVCRSSLELTAIAIGWLLGGQVGVGTLITSFGMGMTMQLVFRAMKFDPTTIRHETLAETWRSIVP